MRTLPPGFGAHLATGATTLATCWKISRRDGVVLGFTDHDEVLSFDGVDYAPAHGLDGAEVPHKLGARTATTDVVGILHSDAIAEEDILLGRYDGAEVESWRVNWRNPEERLLQHRSTIGEIVREDGLFRAELRSAQHALNRSSGRLYQALCDADLGDGRCGVGLDTATYSALATVAEVQGRFRLAIDGIESFSEGWFGFGLASWENGRRAGLRDRIVTHDRVGGTDVLSFTQPVGEWVAPGDVLVAAAGCDRRFQTCREKFSNAVNFRGFPHVPGNDFVLRYPREGSSLDGRPVLS